MLRSALERVLRPLARLAVSQGVPYAQAEELLKQAYVQAARDKLARDGDPPTRDVSQVSVATGLSRREVQRLSTRLQTPAMQRPAPATQVFTRWLSDPAWHGDDGRPGILPRSGPAPSFEALANSVTRHVHARSLLDELCRLGLAELDAEAQTVRLLRTSFVPADDDPRLLGFLGHNVGDHLSAAFDNVLHRDHRHVEQAVFTDELSAPAAQQVRALAYTQWQQLLATIAPAMERLIEEDRAQGRAPTHRARVGLFSYQEPLSETDHEDDPAAR